MREQDRHRSLGSSSSGNSPAGSFSLSDRRRSSLASDILGDHGGASGMRCPERLMVELTQTPCSGRL